MLHNIVCIHRAEDNRAVCALNCNCLIPLFRLPSQPELFFKRGNHSTTSRPLYHQSSVNLKQWLTLEDWKPFVWSEIFFYFISVFFTLDIFQFIKKKWMLITAFLFRFIHGWWSLPFHLSTRPLHRSKAPAYGLYKWIQFLSARWTFELGIESKYESRKSTSVFHFTR